MSYLTKVARQAIKNEITEVRRKLDEREHQRKLAEKKPPRVFDAVGSPTPRLGAAANAHKATANSERRRENFLRKLVRKFGSSAAEAAQEKRGKK